MKKNWQLLRDNSDLKKTFLIREKIYDSVRSFFKQEGFHEVETPLLVKKPGTEPYLEVFATTLHINNQREEAAFLLTSPELQMKKLLAAGLGNIFQICKSFRNNEGISDFHNHEFSILEWYRVNADYTHIMADFEALVAFIYDATNQHIDGSHERILHYQGRDYDLSAPWQRLSVSEAFFQYAAIDTTTLLDWSLLMVAAKKKGYTQVTNWEEAYHSIFLNEIEPYLGQKIPTILYDYPASQAALSQKKQSDPRFAERFEVYLAGLELGNAFTELRDPQEQKTRMEADLKLRSELGKTNYELDNDFIMALESGFPPTGGIAVGLDRLVMLFADVVSIKEVLFFPTQEMFAEDEM